MEDHREAPGVLEPNAHALHPLQPDAHIVNEPEASDLGPRQPSVQDGGAATTVAPAAPAAPEQDARAAVPDPRQPAAEDGDGDGAPPPTAAASCAMSTRAVGGPDSSCNGSSCSGTGNANSPFINFSNGAHSVFIFSSPSHQQLDMCLEVATGDGRVLKRSRRREVEHLSD